MPSNTDIVVSLVLNKFPDVTLGKIQSYIQEYVRLFLSAGVETIYVASASDFVANEILLLPDHILRVELVYRGTKQMQIANVSDMFAGNLGSDHVYIGSYLAANRKAVYFGVDAKTDILTVPVKLLCKSYSNTAGEALPDVYIMAIYYYVLYCLYTEAQDTLAGHYEGLYHRETEKITKPVSNTYFYLGGDL